MCSLLSFVPFFHEEAKFQQLFFLIFFIFCTILQMWRSNTQVHRNNKLYWEFKNDELSQASFLHLVSKNNKVFMSTQDISVISTDNISHPMYRRSNLNECYFDKDTRRTSNSICIRQRLTVNLRSQETCESLLQCLGKLDVQHGAS